MSYTRPELLGDSTPSDDAMRNVDLHRLLEIEERMPLLNLGPYVSLLVWAPVSCFASTIGNSSFASCSRSNKRNLYLLFNTP